MIAAMAGAQVKSFLLASAAVLCFAFALGSHASASPLTALAARGPAPEIRELVSSVNQTGDLSGADRLYIRFKGLAELSGEYRVNIDGAISIPVIGRVTVGNGHSADLEKLLSQKVSEIAGSEAYVTVEVSSYRPVYITGFVARSGAVQWQPNMTVLQAVSAAGGVGALSRSPLTNEQVPPDEARIRKLIDDQKRTLAVLARLRAELAEQSTIEVPAPLIALVGKDAAGKLIERERAVLAARRSSQENVLMAIERGQRLAKQELDSLRNQNLRLTDQIRMRQEDLKRVQELQAKGITTRDRSLEAEIKVSDLEEKRINIAVSIARVEALLAGLEKDGLAARQGRRIQIDEELRKTERDAAQFGIDLEAVQGASTESVMSRKSSIRFEIVRPGSEPQIAGLEAQLAAGDVLLVSKEEEPQ